jgi:hypothetical protein
VPAGATEPSGSLSAAFAGRNQHIGLTRFWPETAAVLDTFPSVAEVSAAFGDAGFSHTALQPVCQLTASSLAVVAATVRREAHTPLTLISDAAYQAGLVRLHAAAATDSGPAIDCLDLLVLRNAVPVIGAEGSDRTMMRRGVNARWRPELGGTPVFSRELTPLSPAGGWPIVKGWRGKTRTGLRSGTRPGG